MKNNKLFPVIISIFFLFISGCGKSDNETELEDKKPVPVKAESAATGTITREYTYAARLKPERQVAVVPEAAGKVREVYFDIGDTVKEGDILFKIDEKSVRDNIKELEKQLEAVNLNIELQELSLSSAKDGQYKQQVLQLEQQVKMAQIGYDTAKKSLQDVQNLYDQGMASQQQFNQAESACRQAEVSLNSARENYNLFITELSQTNIETKEKQLEQTVIQKEQLKLSLNNLNEMLGKTAVKSPISGLVASRNVEKEQMVSMQNASFTIIQTENMLIDVGVSEKVVSKVNINDQVDIVIDSLSKSPYKGEIYAIAPSADERTSAYLTKIRLDNKEQLFKAGMFAEVSFEADRRKDVVIVPINSVLSDASGQYVFVVDGDSAKRLPVLTGLDNGTHIEIIEGLSAGESLIVEGQNYVEDNGLVMVVK